MENLITRLTPDFSVGDICIGILDKNKECKHWIIYKGKIDQWDRGKIISYLESENIININHFLDNNKNIDKDRGCNIL